MLSNKLNKEEEQSKRLTDSNANSTQQIHRNSKVDEPINQSNMKVMESSRNINPADLGSGEVETKDRAKNFKTITSKKYSSPEEENGTTESFIPFSQRTSMTHAPTIYEELIQKYEGDIRNHIRIEQQMKLHSDSVINKLEDKEKQYDRKIDQFKKHEKAYEQAQQQLKTELKVINEENQALKKALEKKIEKILTLEQSVKESAANYKQLQQEFKKLQKSFEEAALTPRKSDSKNNVKLGKTKFKANSANPLSGRKSNGDSVQLFYSRNISGPNNMGREEYIIPATSTRSPQKLTGNTLNTKSIVLKRDGKSPYIHADLERLKQYVGLPKANKTHKRSKSQTLKSGSQTRKAVKSVVRGEHLHTDETADDSTHKIKDYNSMQNSIIYRGSKKNVMVGKNNKVKRLLKKNKNTMKNSHFMSYDGHSSLSRYELIHPPSAMDISMDRINKKKKIKAKRNSSISKMLKMRNSALGMHSGTAGYGGASR